MHHFIGSVLFRYILYHISAEVADDAVAYLPSVRRRGVRAVPRQSTRASDPRRGPKWLAAGPVLKNKDRFFKKELNC
jgi:hypothetical protein